MDYLDFALGLFSGVILVTVGQVVTYYLGKKSLKAEQEHSERILKAQLFHEERKKALVELDEILKKSYKTLDDFNKSVEAFLNGQSGIFLPTKLQNDLRKEMKDIRDYLYSKQIEIFGEEPDYPEDDYEAWAAAFPEQALDVEVMNRLSKLKGSMRSKIKEYVSQD